MYSIATLQATASVSTAYRKFWRSRVSQVMSGSMLSPSVQISIPNVEKKTKCCADSVNLHSHWLFVFWLRFPARFARQMSDPTSAETSPVYQRRWLAVVQVIHHDFFWPIWQHNWFEVILPQPILDTNDQLHCKITASPASPDLVGGYIPSLFMKWKSAAWCETRSDTSGYIPSSRKICSSIKHPKYWWKLKLL